MGRIGIAAPALALALGCAAGGDTSSMTSFGSPSFGSNGMPVGTDGSPDDDEGDSEDGSDGLPPDTPADDPNAGGSSTGVADDAPAGSSGMMDPAADGDETGMEPLPGGGAQPAAGMYAACSDEDFAACGPTQGCMTIEAPAGAVGYCTAVGCSNPAVDCDPAPAGSSVTPVCIPVGMEVACGLDCSTAACPTGMDCYLLALDEEGTMTAEICG